MSEFQGRLAPPVESRLPQLKHTPTPEHGFDLERQLREGKYYTNIKLEGYMAENPWPREIVARDILQNFFDANGFTLDGIEIDIQEEGEKTIVTVRGDQSYPYQRLVSFGSGQKDDPRRSAGGKHQGTKDVVVMLLREYGCEGVEYGSEEWALTFYKDELPSALQEKNKEEKEHGVFLHLDDREKETGNFLRFETTDRDMAEAVVKAREFFYHDSNPDFHHADFSSEQGGMRILARNQKGNFYLNGQRVSFEERGKWENVPGFTLWTKQTPEFAGHKFEINRDRDMVSVADVERTVIPFLVESMSPEEQELILFALDAYFSTDQYWKPDSRLGRTLITEIVQRLKRDGKQISFAPRDIADDLDYESSMRSALKDQGYRLCMEVLANAGMPRATELLKEIELQNEVEPKPAEGRRMDILRAAVHPFLMQCLGRLNVTDRDVKLFAGTHPALEAQYAGDFVWMERRALHRERPHETLATYFHELCHEFGSDESASFSYKLTDLLAEWTEYLADHPETLRELERLWKENPVERAMETVGDLLTFARPVIEKEHHRHGIYLPEQLENRDRTLNRLAEDLLDIISEKNAGVVSADALFDIWETVTEHPVTKRLKKTYASWQISTAERDRIQEMKDRVHADIARYSHELGVIFQKRKALDEGKGQHKRGRMELRKEYDQLLELLREEIRELEKELVALREQLPEEWELIQPSDRLSIFGRSFEPSRMTDPTFFFVAGLRVLHAQFPVEREDHQMVEEMQKELQSVLDRLLEEAVKDPSTSRGAARRVLTMELDLHLGFTRKLPTRANILFGQMLLETIEGIKDLD